MKTRLFAALLAAVMSLTLFVGCEGNGGKTTVATTTTTEETTTTTEETTTTAEETTTTEEETTTTKKTTTKKKTTTTTKAPTTKWTIVLGKTTTKAEETTTTVAEETTTTEAEETTTTTKRTRTSKSSFSFDPIPQTMTPEEAAAAVTHVDGTLFTKIPKETAAVTTFNPKWKFTHHTGVTIFQGKIFAMFSQHEHSEDFPGQQLVVSYSSDFYTWSEPKAVIKPFQSTFTDNQTAIVPAGIYVADGKLFVTCMSYDYMTNHFGPDGSFSGGSDGATAVVTGYMAYTEDGVNWSEPIKCGEYVGDSLRKTYFGRWLCMNGITFFYSDEKTPDGFIWERTGLTEMQKQDAFNRIKDTGVLNPVFTEASWYQTQDNVLFMMSRTNTGVMYLSQSYDGGETWTDAHPTNFSSSNNLFPMGELPDGRIYAVGTPHNPENDWEQWPLNLYVSKDGYNFDKAYTISDEKYQMVENGYSKGGYFGYPHVTMDDTYMYVLHSKMKEVMEIHRIKISDIQ